MHLLLLSLLACETDPSPQSQPGTPTVDPVLSPLELTELDDGALSELCASALAASPTWIQPDLELAFRRVDADLREELAALLVDLDDPYLTDELAFTIAHLSPEVLDYDDFDPQLLIQNVEMIRDVDASLAYADIIDTGEPGVDTDYSSTVRYQYDVGGVTETVDLPSEYYYWYIVHPRIEDERPLFIDAWERCSSRGLECGTTAEEGGFWRPFLWEAAAETCPEGEFCPTLSESMGEVATLWSTDGGGVGAVGAIASFMLSSDETLGRWFSFGAGSERSIQPNRIYGLGAGNCGEWADMTTALSRLALIPNYNVVPSSWDHTWNAFYDPMSARWVNWEPVNWWFDHAYGAPYANHATRGDGAVLMVTGNDTDSVFTMEVVVTDTAGRPVDGASVSVYSPYESFWWWAGEAVTDSTGTARFELTAGQEFAYRVDSPYGGYPSNTHSIDYGSSGVEAGVTDTIQASIDGALPVPATREAAEADAEPNATLHVGGQVNAGRLIATSQAYNSDTYTVEDVAPPVRWFVTDTDGYSDWLDGQSTPVLAEGLLGDDGSVSLDTREERVLVVVNEDLASTAALGALDLGLEGEGEPQSWAGSLVLLPGEHRAFALSGGEALGE